MSGMLRYEEVAETDKYNEFIETIFAIVQPKAFKSFNDKKKLQRSEEGVDHVIYKGEDNWEEIKKDFEAFGLTNLDLWGETLNNG